GCPMHPEVVSEEPGSCPECGMKLLATAVAEYVCPMHPDVVGTSGDDRCPKCGMKLLPSALVASAAAHGHGHGTHDRHGGGHHGHDHAAGDDRTRGIEWEDDMVDVNRITTPANTRWKLVDKATGAANHAIDWGFHVGDRVKL